MGGAWKIPTPSKRDYLRLDDPIIGVWAGTNDGGIVYGLDLQTGPNQMDKFKAALAHVGRDGVPSTILITGTFAVDGTISKADWPTDVQPNLVGTGSGDGISTSAAGILFRTDSGGNPEEPTAEAAIWTTKDHTVHMEGFTIAGPGFGGGASYGGWPAHLSGLYVEGACVIRGMRIYGFGAGVLLQNDHHKLEDVNLQSNGYAINFVNNPTGGLGDETFLKCQLTNQTRASIAICDTNTIANARFGDNGHSGSAPYGVYRYSNKDGVTGAATGSAASNQLTGVNITTRVPGVGARVSGTNIAWGTYITAVSGSSGNYTLTLSANPTGAVASVTVYQVPRGTCMSGVVHENWSIEGVGNSVFYDEPDYEYNAPGGWTYITHDSPADVSSFGAQELRWAQLVSCVGASGASVLTNVALSDWQPLVGDRVENVWAQPEAATPIPLDTVVTSVSGAAGNWTIGISNPLAAAATQVRIGKPVRHIVYDVGNAANFHWREGPVPIIPAEVPSRYIPYLIRAHTIFDITADTIAIGNFDDYPQTRLFKVHTGTALNPTLPGEHAAVMDGIALGWPAARSGRMGASARVAWTNVLKGQVMEVHSYATCGPWLGTAASMYCGIAITDTTAGNVVLLVQQGANSFVKVLNTSGVSIPQGTLLKPHASGGVQAAAVGDSPIIGRAHDGAIAAGALGIARLTL